MMINGVRWFKLMYPNPRGSYNYNALFCHKKPSRCNLIISWVREGGRRYFTAFDSLIDFMDFYNSTPRPNRAFHEIIPGNRPQKMRFDIDLDNKKIKEYQLEGDLDTIGEQVTTKLIDEIIEEFPNLEIMKDILIFDSSNKIKFSRHIIITSLAVDTCECAKQLFDRLTSQLTDYINQGIIDHGIYSNYHGLRIMGCIKEIGHKRIKRLLNNYTYKNQAYSYVIPYKNTRLDSIHVLTQSLISVIDGCQLIDVIIPPKIQYQATDLPQALVDLVVNLVREEVFPHYSLDSVKGTCIFLKKSQPYDCPICEREHTSTSLCGVAVIRGSDIIHYCGRSKGIGEIIGTVEGYSYSSERSDDNLEILDSYVPPGRSEENCSERSEDNSSRESEQPVGLRFRLPSKISPPSEDKKNPSLHSSTKVPEDKKNPSLHSSTKVPEVKEDIKPHQDDLPRPSRCARSKDGKSAQPANKPKKIISRITRNNPYPIQRLPSTTERFRPTKGKVTITHSFHSGSGAMGSMIKLSAPPESYDSDSD